MSSSLSCAVVGAGLQAGRLVSALVRAGNPIPYVVGASDGAPDGAEELARSVGAKVVSFDQVLADGGVGAVLVASPPDSHEEYAARALLAGRHVFCEKPLTTTVDGAERLARLAESERLVLWCGLNHRHHPAFRRLVELIGAEEVLELRIAYGIAGTEDAGGTWRRDAGVVAGGHLMEQGIHAIDLALRLMPGLDRLAAVTQQRVIPSRGRELEDSATVLLADASGGTATVHSSLLQWVNLFRLEAVTATQYLRMEGLSAAYGEQTLTRYARSDDSPFQGETTHFRGDDKSWGGQWNGFLDAVRDGRSGDVADALPSLRAVFAAYDAAASGAWIPLAPSQPTRPRLQER